MSWYVYGYEPLKSHSHNLSNKADRRANNFSQCT